MKIILNNREEVLSGENLSVIPREEYESTIIHDGDNVQMIYLMSGG
jgi:sulfur carrier protein ThiS